MLNVDSYEYIHISPEDIQKYALGPAQMNPILQGVFNCVLSFFFHRFIVHGPYFYSWAIWRRMACCYLSQNMKSLTYRSQF